MITEVTLLKLFINKRSDFAQYGSFVKHDALTRETKTLLTDIKLYYEEFEDEHIDLNKFVTWFQQIRHPELKQTEHAIYHLIFERLEDEAVDEDDEYVKKVLNHFKKEAARERILELLESNELKVTDIKKELDEYVLNTEVLEEDFTENDFTHIFVKKKRESGLRWRLDCLNKSIGPLIPGDFGYVAAYVDTGKSKFLISEAAYMAQQIQEGSVLWFNNEGPEDRVQQQLWCAVLEVDSQKLIENEDRARKRYAEKLHGDMDRIKVFDAVGYTPDMIREKAERYNAKLIIIDMLDHLLMPGAEKNAEVIRLKNLYREIRNISKDFCPVIGSSQCDGSVTWTDHKTQSAQFQRYIGMHQLDYSRSAKQAAAEFIITIGRDPEMPLTRYIHVPKNKLDGDGTGLSRNIKSEVRFDGKRSLYY